MDDNNNDSTNTFKGDNDSNSGVFVPVKVASQPNEDFEKAEDQATLNSDEKPTEDSETIKTQEEDANQVDDNKKEETSSSSSEDNNATSTPTLNDDQDDTKLTDFTPSESSVDLMKNNQPSHVKKPIGVIVIAIIIAILLAGLSVYMYKKNQPKPLDNSAASSQQTQEIKEQATTKTVDTTVKEIDDSINGQNDEKDFPQAELDDSTLNL